MGSGGGTGGNYSGKPGGGAVELTVLGTLTVDGAIAANGTYSAQSGGGGAGGGIQLEVGLLDGTGVIEANGGSSGNGWGGGGGGGRIAIYSAACDVDAFGGTITVAGGSGYQSGSPGTLHYGIIGTQPVGIVTTAGAVEERDPSQDQVTDISPGNWESSGYIRVFVEQVATPLPGQVTVDVSVPGVYDDEGDLLPDIIPGGWIVNSHVLHLDSVGGDPVSLGGSVTFGTPVLGVILTDGNLDDSEEVDYGTWTQRVLARRDLTYPHGVPGRGLELDSPEGDSVTLSPDRLTVTFDGLTDTAIDQVRIITSGHVQDYNQNNVPDECEHAADHVLMVDDDAQGANDGSSWDDAFNSLQDALAASEASGGAITEIWIAAGTYWPDDGGGQTPGDQDASFHLSNNLALYGGFAGGEVLLEQRDWELNQTVLSGDIGVAENDYDNSYTVVLANNVDSTSIVDGITIAYGNANNPSGWYYNEDDAGICGGGVFHYFSSPKLIRCTFSENSAYMGGGTSSFYSNPTLTDCTFSRNSTDIAGGGIFTYGGNAILANCTFHGNSAGCGGGACINGGDPFLVNSTFHGNSAEYGGGTCIMTGEPILTHCTFSGNSANDSGGAVWGFVGSATLNNCVLWGNTAPNDPQMTESIVAAYCCVEGGWAGEGNIDLDPLFLSDPDPGPDGEWGTADDDYGDLRLQPDSPCIDAGDNTAVPLDLVDLDDDGNKYGEQLPFDLQGLPRFMDVPDVPDTGVGTPPIVDMGAYEVIGMVDCNGNGVDDADDITAGTSDDYNLNGIPDECDDCNANGIPDACDTDCSVANCSNHPLGCGASTDCQPNGFPDECELPYEDCNTNGIVDECELITSPQPDDHFDDGVLDPSWTVTFDGATDWVYTEAGTLLTVTDVAPSVVNGWNDVTLTRTFSADGDFHVDLDLSWESYDVDMQKAWLALRDEDDAVVARGMHHDGWHAHTGQKYAQIGTSDWGSGSGTLPASGGGVVTLERVDGVVTVLWDGSPLLSAELGASIASLEIGFSYYDYSSGSSFGAYSLDRVWVSTPEMNDCNANGVLDECETIAGGDFNADGYVNSMDFVALAECLAGPYTPPTAPSPECVDACLAAFDDDTDSDIDLADFAVFQRAFGGP